MDLEAAIQKEKENLQKLKELEDIYKQRLQALERAAGQDVGDTEAAVVRDGGWTDERLDSSVQYRTSLALLRSVAPNRSHHTTASLWEFNDLWPLKEHELVLREKLMGGLVRRLQTLAFNGTDGGLDIEQDLRDSHLPGEGGLQSMDQPTYRSLHQENIENPLELELEVARIRQFNAKLYKALSQRGRAIGVSIMRAIKILATSDVAPTIQTFNILLIQLCNLQQWDAAGAVAEAIWDCNIIPNEITVAALLRLRSHRGDIESFRLLVSRMDVECGAGLLPWHKATKHLFASYPHLKVVGLRRQYEVDSVDSTLNIRAEKIDFLKMPRNEDVYNALIIGWLDLGDLRSAMTELLEMKRIGFEPHIPILFALLRYCVRHRNWSLGKETWNRIADLAKTDQVTRNKMIELYYWMLQLCASCSQLSEFDLVVKEGLSRNFLQQELQLSYFRPWINPVAAKSFMMDGENANDFQARLKKLRTAKMFQISEEVQRLDDTTIIPIFDHETQLFDSIDEEYGNGIAQAAQAKNLFQFLVLRLKHLYHKHKIRFSTYPDISLFGFHYKNTNHEQLAQLWIGANGSVATAMHIGEAAANVQLHNGNLENMEIARQPQPASEQNKPEPKTAKFKPEQDKAGPEPDTEDFVYRKFRFGDIRVGKRYSLTIVP